MEKTNYEWLVRKLREAETERDKALEHAEIVELDNLRLRVKLQTIADYVQNVADFAGDEEDIKDLLADNEDDSPCIPEEKTDKSGIPFA